ncbi:MAG: hypothetical protein E6686_10230 [Lachnospiraceae bacterium]|nr:hypothetical protein [Lachnospiraceae bacterium]
MEEHNKKICKKDFVKGQNIYVLYTHQGRNAEPEIFERTVEKVGRKYVTDNKGVRYGEHPYYKSFLVEESNCGEKGFLFCTEQEAKEYIEKVKLMRWISTFSFAPVDDYSAEDLRKVKEILEKGMRARG